MPGFTSTSGLTPDRLARLLTLAGSSNDGEAQPQAADCPERIALEAMLARDLAREMLIDGSTDPRAIRRIKDDAKGQGAESESDAGRAAATAIYFAAIAHALVFRRQRISRLSHQELAGAFEHLLARPWIPGEIRDLLTRAAAVCGPRTSTGRGR